jgi:hypothetical protein
VLYDPGMRTITIAVVAALVVAPILGSDGLDLDLELRPAEQLLGCPTLPVVVVRNTGSEKLQVPAERQLREMLRLRSDKPAEVTFESGSPSEPIVWQTLEPGQELQVVLGEYRGPKVCVPGTYEITVEYDDADLRHPSETPIRRTSGPVELVYTEPGGIDKDAFDAVLAALRDLGSTRLGCPESQVRDAFANLGFVDGFPNCTYAGYVLARLGPILPGVGEDPEDKVSQLTSAEFFTRFPKTYLKESPPPTGAWLPMREAVTERAQLLRRFVDSHPDFPLRESIEKQLGDLELVLGSYERAYRSFHWLEQNAEVRPDWAAGMATALVKLGLVEKGAEQQSLEATDDTHSAVLAQDQQ